MSLDGVMAGEGVPGSTSSGWRGRYYEDFVVGDVYEHPLGRTVTTTDNIWFTLLTQNTAPLHLDHEYAGRTAFGQPLVNSTFTLALVAGQSVTDISQNVFANLGWGDISLPHPLFEGDTVHSRSRVLNVRESASRPQLGVVGVQTQGRRQTGQIVVDFTRTLLVYKRGCGPGHGADGLWSEQW